MGRTRGDRGSGGRRGAGATIPNIAALLARVGGTLGDLVDTTTFLLDRADLPSVQKVRDELALASPPASTSLVVAALGDPAFLVEIKAIAHIPYDRYRNPED